MEADTLVYEGEPVKVLSRARRDDGTETATLGGYLALFTGPGDPDLVGDFFTKDTDFGVVSLKGEAALPAYYQHGFDQHFKNRAIGTATVKIDDFGAWAEYQIELRTDYERHLVEMAERGKMGQSSGAVSHLVERQQVGKSFWIKVWPLGEASLTPTPAEPRTGIMPIKVFLDKKDPGNIKGRRLAARLRDLRDEQDRTNEELADAAGIDVSTMQQILSGSIVRPPDERLRGLARLLGVSLSSLQRLADEDAGKKMPAESAEPRTSAVPVKNLYRPEGETRAPVAPPAEPITKTQETMPETEVHEPAQSAPVALTLTLDDIKGVVRGAVEDKMKAFREDRSLDKDQTLKAPALIETRGDSEAKSLGRWIKRGDQGAVKDLMGEDERGVPCVVLRGDPSVKASNATDMNIGTAADGGYAVPTGHFQQIIARRDEANIAARLAVRNIPGVGTTVNVPLDAEDDGEFVSTAEAAANDLDAPALGTKAMTLVKYTKKVLLSDELLQDEDSQLLSFLSDFVGRGMAKTHNNLLITEVGTNGTSFKTFASATTIAAGEVQDILYSNALANYLDDSGSVAWVTQPATHGIIAKLQGNPFIYDSNPQGSGSGMRLLGFPVLYSTKVAAPASTTKSIYFGNWFYVGVRNSPEFQILRDPYSNAATGQLTLHYYFRTVYGVLQAEAIGYGKQAT